jgi:uncharacterized cupin superfamily protein
MPQPQVLKLDSTTVTEGESFVVPKGFIGSWEVVQATTKRFVIYEAGT